MRIGFNDLNRLHYTIFGDPANLAAVRTTLAASDTAAGTIEYATQAEMETGTDATKAVTAGRAHFAPSSCKAHASWNDAGVLGATTFGVSSVTDNGTGNHSVNFTTALSSAEFSAAAMVLVDNGFIAAPLGAARSVSAIQIITRNAAGTAVDVGVYGVVVFGDI